MARPHWGCGVRADKETKSNRLPHVEFRTALRVHTVGLPGIDAASTAAVARLGQLRSRLQGGTPSGTHAPPAGTHTSSGTGAVVDNPEYLVIAPSGAETSTA